MNPTDPQKFLSEIISIMNDEDILRFRHRARKRGFNVLAELLLTELNEREHQRMENIYGPTKTNLS